jgi:class 3 adenylate cyclase
MVRTETVTVLFTDLVGSTELADGLGHAVYEALRTAHFDALRSAVTTHSGTEVKTTGDGLMVCFGSVGDAVDCAVAMQQATALQTRRAPFGPPAAKGDDRGVQIRVGMSVGEATRESNDFYGTPVVEAARLCAAARPGQILAADVVRVLSRGLGHSFAVVGEIALKGLIEAVVACEVGWEPLADEGAIPLPPLLAAGQQFAFAGRHSELSVLSGMWTQVQEGARRVALIAGEPGIGKTRLAAEVAQAAHGGGATVLYGRCDDELGVPFQPFVEALRYFVERSVRSGPLPNPPPLPEVATGEGSGGKSADRAPSPANISVSGGGLGWGQLRDRLGRHPGELVRLMPELADVIPNLPPPLQSDAETERYRMFDEVACWLATASAERPLVLILDDLHWAAKPTLLLLKHVLRFQPSIGEAQPRLLLIGTYRDSELDRAHPLAEILAELRKDSTVQRLALRGLDLAGVEAFIAGAAGHELDDAARALARAVHAETEGNPFFIGEVLRHLEESRAVVPREGRWVTARPVEQLGIPEGVKEVIGRRLNRLSAAANQALSVAAVIGRDFDVGVLGAVSQLDEETVVDALDEAVRARLVNETGVVDAYRFAHALVRETLYADASASKRVRLHRRIADAIAARWPDDVIALAYHYQQAAAGGDVEKAVEYGIRAGDQACTQLAYMQAAHYYRQALELLGGTEAHSLAQRCELLIRLGEAQRDALDGDETFHQILLDAARLSQHLGDGGRLARAALANTRRFGVPAPGQVDDERIALLEAALAALDKADSPVRAQLLANLLCELTYAPDRDRLIILADEALAMARRLGDPATLAHVLRFRSYVFATPDTLAERRAIAAELVALAEQFGNVLDRIIAHSQLMIVSRAAGDIAETDRQLAIMAEMQDECALPGSQYTFNWAQACRAMLAGRIAEAERFISRMLEISQATRLGSSQEPGLGLLEYVALLDVRRMQGRLAELEPFAAKLLADHPRMPAVRAALAAIYCELERDTDARLLFEADAANGFAELRYAPAWLGAMVHYARACAHLGARDAAGVLYERLAPWHAQLAFDPNVNGSVALYLGLLATTLDRYADAEAHFAEAHTMHERIGAPYWLAVTRVDWAKMLLRRNQAGDRDRARAMLEQALATAREYGFAGVERDATRLLEPPPE